MAYLGIVEAIRSRLVGNDPQLVPSLPALSIVRSEGPIQEASTPGRLRESTAMLRGQVKVPVFDPDPLGKRHNVVYPSMSFNVISCTPRYEEAVYYSESYHGDGYQIPLAGSEEDVYDGDVFLQRAARAYAERPIEHPMDVLFEVVAYAAESLTKALLAEYIYSVFPPRGYLRVPMKDGSFRSWDLLFQSAKNIEATKIPYESLGLEREQKNVWTYKVEAYLDNTDCAQLVQCVRSYVADYGLTQ